MDCWSDEVTGLANCTITGTGALTGCGVVGGGTELMMFWRSLDIFGAGTTGAALDTGAVTGCEGLGATPS